MDAYEACDATARAKACLAAAGTTTGLFAGLLAPKPDPHGRLDAALQVTPI